MPVISRLFSIPLRIAEIAFAAVVAGIIGHYLASFNQIDPWPQARWIYTEVIAGVSILFALIWLIPFSSGFFSWPLDILLSFAWFAAFGILVNAIDQLPCGSIWSWGFRGNSLCSRWKAAEAFSFLSAIVWLVSALVGIWFTCRKRGEANAGSGRRWGRSRAAPSAA
ncbi:uncharacterized protein N7498_010264 [Penicillium cinerascens]|uniref:MARVEL domain-containing protein n=1 Tax=Penicillium cinerascens TaxID=70096 RepID=A0A9W9J665_9EURO|nr:uncharacterized protein N7498_010264 [Penicillium cinerascens]KAJ5191279.1 hypothetical protein N7498_010264 [Penicillium cinerascens]